MEDTELDRALVKDFFPGAEAPFEWRPHRWNLADAMAEKRTFHTLKELFDYLVEREYRASGVLLADDLQFDRIGPNKETGWDEWAVVGSVLKEPERSLVLGYTDGEPGGGKRFSSASSRSCSP